MSQLQLCRRQLYQIHPPKMCFGPNTQGRSNLSAHAATRNILRHDAKLAATFIFQISSMCDATHRLLFWLKFLKIQNFPKCSKTLPFSSSFSRNIPKPLKLTKIFKNWLLHGIFINSSPRFNPQFWFLIQFAIKSRF